MADRILSREDFAPGELARLAAECFETEDEYLKQRNSPNTKDWASQEGITQHEVLKRAGTLRKVYQDEDRKRRNLEKVRMAAAGRTHCFVLLGKDGGIIHEYTDLTKQEQESLILDFSKARQNYIAKDLMGAVDYATELDIGTKILPMPDL